LRVSRFNKRTVLLLLGEAILIFCAVVGAVYLRLGVQDSAYELIVRHGYLKAALATLFCLTAFYLFDLYDFIVMHDRRELVLRLVQALGLAWIALAFSFYAYPDLMIVCGEAKFHDDHGDVLLNPTVIFEVLSPSTETYDRGERFRRYRTEIDSLQDYVMVSQAEPRLEKYSRQADDTWLLSEVSELDGELLLPSIECRLPLVEVYASTRVGVKGIEANHS